MTDSARRPLEALPGLIVVLSGYFLIKTTGRAFADTMFASRFEISTAPLILLICAALIGGGGVVIARAKGRSLAWALVGFLGIPGILILALLCFYPGLHKSKTAGPQAAPRG